MKKAFIVFDLDSKGALKPHTHPIFKGKEFCHEGEVFAAIIDHNNDHSKKPFKGSLIIHMVVTV